MKRRVRLLCRSGLLCAVLCVCALIRIPVGAVPMTFAVFGVLLCGSLLPPSYAALPVCVYLFLGAIGVPVFSSMTGGIGALFGPTGGFLLAYPLLALIPSVIFSCHKRVIALDGVCGIALAAVTDMLAMSVCYMAGTAYYAWTAHISFGAALGVCVLPFLLADILKIALCLWITRILSRHLPML